MTGPIREVAQGPLGLARGESDTDGMGPPLHAGGPENRLQPPPGHLNDLGQSQTPLDRLLAGADTLARFRGEPVSIPSSPVSQPGELARTGDVNADAGAHMATPVGRGPDVTVGTTIGAAGIDARLSFAGPAANQPPWVNAAVQVREPGQVDRAMINLRLITAGQHPAGPASLNSLVQASGFQLANVVPTTGMLVVRGAILEIAGPGGRTILLATTDGGAVLRSGTADTRAAIFVRTPDGLAAPAMQANAAMPGVNAGAVNLAGIGAATGSLAGLLALLGGAEQQMALWLARPDGTTAAFAPAEDVKSRWSELKERLGHDPARIARMEAVLYDVLATRFAALGVDLAARAPALRDVVWTIAVEHGPWPAPDGSDILSQVAQGKPLATLADSALVDALFDEQLRRASDDRLIHYPELATREAETAITDRLASERKVALARLAAQA